MITQLPAIHVNAATGEPLPQFQSPAHPGIRFWNRSTIEWLDAVRKETEIMRAGRKGVRHDE